MSNTQSPYVGFVTLEELLAAHETGMAIYIATITECRNTDTIGFCYRHTYLQVSDVADGIGRYWRMSMGESPEHCGEPMDRDLSDRILQRVKTAEEEVKRLLLGRFDKVFGAVISFPRDLRILEGTTELLIYDPSENRFAAAAVNVERSEP